MRALFLVAAALLTIGADAPSAATSGPAPIAQFTQGLTPARGLFTIWRKSGKVYLQLAKSQLDTPFIQNAEPASGLGGYGVTVGLPYIAAARIITFSRVDDKIVLTWPNTSFAATGNPAAEKAVEQSFAPSIVATTPVVAQDAKTGDVIFDAAPFLGDVIDMQEYLRLVLNTDKNPTAAYKLDADRTYWGTNKAFPQNVILEADQTFASAQPQTQTSVTIDNVPDPRSVQIRIKYNIVQAPPAGSYVPRIADDRVGYFANIMLDYGNDKVTERQRRYILRWNIARHPMVYYISNTVPAEYRQTIREALLTWNDAFWRVGIPNAVEVRDQPDDPNWDEDDIRYNTVHWLTQSNSGGYAEAGLVWDPRTGELIKTSIVIDGDLLSSGFLEGADFAGPARTQSLGIRSEEAKFAAGARASMAFGVWALDGMGEYEWGQAPPGYLQSFLRYIVLHESGHNWGLQHNFIGTQAYTASQDQSKAFTAKFGVSSSVMAYIPTNVWPAGTRNGSYFQTVLGTYDYYAIHWGYAPVPGAQTPAAELPTLRQWASKWSDPMYRFASDEDVMWAEGHAIDPRVNHWELSGSTIHPTATTFRSRQSSKTCKTRRSRTCLPRSCFSVWTTNRSNTAAVPT